MNVKLVSIVLALTCLVFPANVSAKVAILVDTSLLLGDATTGAYAIFYLGSRAGYYDEHAAELPKVGQLIVPTFHDELYAFSKTITFTRELEAQKEDTPEYWRKMAAIEKAGYLKEYLAVFRKKSPSAEVRATLRIDEFKKWAKSNLKKTRHEEVEKYGQIANEG
jgi:hypothetical protein